MEKAYSVFERKEFREDSEFMYLKGVATTPTVDRVGDIVEPLGVTFKDKLKLFLYHAHNSPVGQVEFGKPTKTGIPFSARIPFVKEAGRVKDRVDEAIHSLKYDLISAVSIGFNVLKDGAERIDGGYRYTKTELMELSLVPIPANAEAVITAIKSMEKLTAKQSPGDSGSGVRKGAIQLIPRKT